MKVKILCGVVGILIVLWTGSVMAQSESQAVNLTKEARTILDNAKSKDDYQRAAQKYEEALKILESINSVNSDKLKAICFSRIGVIQSRLDQNQKSIEYYEKSLALCRKTGLVQLEGTNLLRIALIYKFWGQSQKALEYYEKSLEISRKTRNAKDEGFILTRIGDVYQFSGQYQKALKYYEESLVITRQISDFEGEASTDQSMAALYRQIGEYDKALKSSGESLAIKKRIGVDTWSAKELIGVTYLDQGNVDAAEPLLKEANYVPSLGRLCLMKSDYVGAGHYYEKLLKSSEKSRNVDRLFTAFTGLGKVNEARKDFQKASEFYEKGMNLIEELRSGLLPSERQNFFDLKNDGFSRSEPAKGLMRVRLKLNRPDESIGPTELTRARAFADHLSLASLTAGSSVPKRILEEEQSLVIKLATLKKALSQTDSEKQSEKYKLSIEIERSDSELTAFVNKLWKDYPAYAAVKYPRPPSLKDSALRPDECAVIFDVSTEGVGVILVRDKAVSKAFYLDLKLSDLERDVVRFREPFEKLRLKDYDPALAKSLYDKLLRPALVDVPKGAPLTIIPDGILAMLPFEALVTGGEARWNKSEKGFDYPQGLTFLGDERPISYYQSITALTLVRTIGNKEKPKDSLLVVADPVFNMKDKRAQNAGETRLSQKEKEYNIQRMAAMEDDLGPLFPQLPETGKLAANLSSMYGSNCLAITGLKADKLDFLAKVAPRMDQYGKVVFATHGVMGNKVPGVMEPFLALTMVPPGTDGFLKMSDILSLKMNSDIVALTACQTGLGKELSGEGVMSMGRAFQYAGAKSVLMTLWEVADTSSVKLTESFFQHRKSGKTKLESLKLARDEIRKQGFEHPFFWAAFILVGEAS